MRSMLWFVAGVLAATQVAVAADRPARPAAVVPSPVIATAVDWAGFYAGFGVGERRPTISITSHMTQSCSVTTVDPGTSACNLSGIGRNLPSSLAGYVLAGYSRQHGRLVFGADGDVEIGKALAPRKDAVDCNQVDVCASTGEDLSLNPLGHLRATVGLVLHPRIVAFLAGGIAFGHATASTFAITKAFGPIDEDRDEAKQWMVGSSFGGGIDVKTGDRMRVRVEGLVDRFGGLDFAGSVSSASASGGNSAAASATASGSARFTNKTVRVSLIWDF